MGSSDPKKERDFLVDLIQSDSTRAMKILREMDVSPYDYGTKLTNTGNIQGALEWYKSLILIENDIKYLYGLAITKWYGNDPNGAIRDCEYILAQENVGQLTLARTHFLMGSAAHDLRNLTIAEEHLQKSYSLYETLDKSGGQYLCLAELGQLYVSLKRYQEAISFLENALVKNEELERKGFVPYSLGRYYETLSYINFMKKEFSDSVENARLSEQEYRSHGELIQADQMKAKLGLCLFVSGETVEAHSIATELWYQLENVERNEQADAYNAIT